MNALESFERWAPPEARWSPWVKPVLFAVQDNVPDAAFLVWREASEAARARWKRSSEPDVALVIDLPGAEGLALALCCATQGWRPVPLYNSCPGPVAVVDNEPLRAGLIEGAEALQAVVLADQAPPAFVLDARRLAGEARPGTFDNRWAVFPQDFPSAARLGAHGIRRVLLVQAARTHPRDDLTHVLRRWHEAGLELHAVDIESGASSPLLVPEPNRFRALGYRLLTALRLQRNAAGGFGSKLPTPTPSGGGHYVGFG